MCAALGWPPDEAAAWRRILRSVTSYADLDPALLGRVEEAIDLLHEQQVALIRDWRRLVESGEKKEADALVPQLLLSVNAIAAGLQTTG